VSARIFTTVQKDGQGIFDATVHLAKLNASGDYVADCGTRVNNVLVTPGQPKQWITCEKCVAKLRREGILD